MSVDSSQAVEELPKDFLAHPYEILERLRAAGPAHPVIFPHGAKVWLVTRYDDVRQLLADPRVSKDGSRANHLFARHAGMITDEDETGGIGVNDDLTMHMLNSDPPRHTRLRSLANQGLTPRRMEESRPRLEQVADKLLDALDDGRPVVDLIAGFTQPMTITTIAEVLGVPSEDEPLFHEWASQLVGAGHDPEVVEAASNSVIAYARKSIEAKRANPGQDMLSMLVHGKDGGDRLTDDELVSMFFLIIMAGHVTSMHTLTNVIHSLLTHPEELARLRADMSMLPSAIDELIRFDSRRRGRHLPVHQGGRRPRRGDHPGRGDPGAVDEFRAPGRHQVPRPGSAGPRPLPEEPPGLRARHPLLHRCAAGPHPVGGRADHAADPVPGPAVGSSRRVAGMGERCADARPGHPAGVAARRRDRLIRVYSGLGSQRNRRIATAEATTPQPSRTPIWCQANPVCRANGPSNARLNGRTGSTSAMWFSTLEWIGK